MSSCHTSSCVVDLWYGLTHKVVSPVTVAVVVVTMDLRQFILVGRWRRWFPDIILLPLAAAQVIVELWRPAFQHRGIHCHSVYYHRLYSLTVRQNLDVSTTTIDSPSSLQCPQNNVWRSDITSSSSQQRLTVRQHLNVFSRTPDSRTYISTSSQRLTVRNHLIVLTTTCDSHTSPRHLHYNVWQSVFTSTSSQQRLTFRHHLSVFTTTSDGQTSLNVVTKSDSP